MPSPTPPPGSDLPHGEPSRDPNPTPAAAWHEIARSAKSAFEIRDFSRSLTEAQRALEFAQQHFPAADPQVVHSVLMCAEVCREAGRLAASLDYYQRYVKIKLDHSSRDEELAGVYCDMAKVHFFNADPASAAQCLRESTATLIAIGKENGLTFLYVSLSLGLALERAGFNAEADATREEAFEVLERGGHTAKELASLWTDFGNVLSSHQLTDRAIAAYDSAHDLLDEVPEVTGCELARLSMQIAQLKGTQGKGRECLKLLARAEEEISADKSAAASYVLVQIHFQRAEFLAYRGAPKAQVQKGLNDALLALLSTGIEDAHFQRECDFRTMEILMNIGETERAAALFERMEAPARDGYGPQVARYFAFKGAIARSRNHQDAAHESLKLALKHALGEWTPELHPLSVAGYKFSLAHALLQSDSQRSAALFEEVEHLLRPEHVGAALPALAQCYFMQARLMQAQDEALQPQRAKLLAALKILDQPGREFPLSGLSSTLLALSELEFRDANYAKAVLYGERAVELLFGAADTNIETKVRIFTLLADAYRFLCRSTQADKIRLQLDGLSGGRDDEDLFEV